ncbi:MAG: endolytic transglycosylase MltG [Flavobacteriaceae bacterium]|nr:endolytic transglycosylase MltG [Flavobacteriaceae bacterium]
MKILTVILSQLKSRKIYIFILLFLHALGFFIYGTIYYNNVKKSGYVLIPHNSNFTEVRHMLTPYLKSERTFKWVSQLKKYPAKIKSGRYYIEKGMSNNTLINKLRSGSQKPITVIFNNQNSLELLAGTIAKQIEADSTSLLKVMLDSTFLKENNLTADNTLGIYIPNSYQFYWNTSAKKFRNKMLGNFKHFWHKNSRQEKADSLNLSPLQIYTLASIVQKETAKVEERPIVAGLYLNRIKRGWALQADPTVIFALKKMYNKDTVIKRVLNKDLRIKSPYNTYLNKGLPPGPIAMPDVSSIDAVLNPAQHNYFFMCASTTNFGYHEFARSSFQHAINAEKYRRWISKQGIRR